MRLLRVLGLVNQMSTNKFYHDTFGLLHGYNRKYQFDLTFYLGYFMFQHEPHKEVYNVVKKKCVKHIVYYIMK